MHTDKSGERSFKSFPNIVVHDLRVNKIRWHAFCRDSHMVARNNSFLVVAAVIFTAVLLGGCTTTKKTDTSRTATEQLLLSTAADRALQSANLMLFANRKVFLDTAYFDSYDSKYVIGTIRDALSRAGAILAENASNTDIIVEARSGALAIDSSETLFGIPALAAPVPLTGSLQMPELAFYKSERQRSTAKIALLAFAKGSREHIYSSGPLDGKSYDKRYRFLFVAWLRTDIPEKETNAKKIKQDQIWFPQYDRMNLPDTNRPATNAPATAPVNTTTNGLRPGETP
jgi:hypothetical protein